MLFNQIYQNRRVLITGHTGFKGAWLCEWLLSLGAKITGFSLPPSTTPALFDQLELNEQITHVTGDIRDPHLVAKLIREVRPDFIFHLAAQPLVRLSYSAPYQTYCINVLGTAAVLEGVRLLNQPCVVVAITTDKCYENKEWINSYREQDPLGGHDPYSSSKAAAELVISGYTRSFFSGKDQLIRVASARAGNVLGGGDWARDRIVPDCIRALIRGAPIEVRNKLAKRPWQHVLEPLSGYLHLAASLHQSSLASAENKEKLCSPFNFGPPLGSNRSVEELVTEVLRYWKGSWVDHSDPGAVHEATLLNLAIDKAYHLLGWRPTWNFEETISSTVDWYQKVSDGSDPRLITKSQIGRYVTDAKKNQSGWC